jgi:hypothetical protein
MFISFAIAAPALLAAPFSKPFIFVILSTLLLLALGYSVVAGSIGGAVGRWWPNSRAERARAK